MEVEQKKSLQAIAQEIIERRKATFTRPLDPDTLRFCEDAMIEALHNNDAYIKWYGEAQTLKAQLKATQSGVTDKHLADQLAEALAQVQTLRGQLVALSKFTGVLPKAEYPSAPSPSKPGKPGLGVLLAAMLLAAQPAVADVRDPVTTVCPDGTIMQQRFDHLIRDSHGRIAMDDVGTMRIAVDVKCKRIMPRFEPLPPPEVID